VLTLRQLLVPYCPIFVAGILFARFGESAISIKNLGLLFGLLWVTSVALAARFRCGRPLLALLSLLGAFAFETLYGLKTSYSLSLALAAGNFLFLITVEDALDWETTGWWAGLILFQVGATYGITRYLNSEWQALNPSLAGPVDVSVLVVCVAVLALLMKFLLKTDAINAGLLWAGLCLLAAMLYGSGFAVIASLLTSIICVAVSLIERSYWIAYHDELTGVPGRRAFNEAIAALDGLYSIAIVDIDHFKSFNDTYGHETGDHVLRKVAAKLRTVGGKGKVFRCGGEEFAILFPLALDDAFRYADAVRSGVEHDTFMVRGPSRSKRERTERRSPERAPRRKAAVPSRVTVSIGVAQGTSGHQVQAVIARADKALYQAKDSGRNRVVAAPAREVSTRRPARVRAAADLG
jgi:diguanylate cyclase (GGDEF)-like protein